MKMAAAAAVIQALSRRVPVAQFDMNARAGAVNRRPGKYVDQIVGKLRLFAMSINPGHVAVEDSAMLPVGFAVYWRSKRKHPDRRWVTAAEGDRMIAAGRCYATVRQTKE